LYHVVDGRTARSVISSVFDLTPHPAAGTGPHPEQHGYQPPLLGQVEASLLVAGLDVVEALPHGDLLFRDVGMADDPRDGHLRRLDAVLHLGPAPYTGVPDWECFDANSRHHDLSDSSGHPPLFTWAGCFLPRGLSASGTPVVPGTVTEWLLQLNG
jgi:hypothetical protein